MGGFDDVVLRQTFVDVGVPESVQVLVGDSYEARTAGMIPGSVSVCVFGDALVEGDDWGAEAEDDSVLVCFRIKFRYVFFVGIPVEGVVDDGVSDALRVPERTSDQLIRSDLMYSSLRGFKK